MKMADAVKKKKLQPGMPLRPPAKRAHTQRTQHNTTQHNTQHNTQHTTQHNTHRERTQHTQHTAHTHTQTQNTTQHNTQHNTTHNTTHTQREHNTHTGRSLSFAGKSIPGCNTYFLCKYLKDTMCSAKTYLFCAIRPEVHFMKYTTATLGFASNASVIKVPHPKSAIIVRP